MAEEKSWLKYKNNQILLIGIGLLAVATGGLIYVKRQENLWAEINSEIDKPVDKVGSGVHGDWRDLYEGEFWNPKTYLARKDIQKPTIDRIAASNYAKQIYDSVGVTNLTSNQDSGIAVFKKLSNRTDIAMVADRFLSIYNKSLVDYLKSHYEGGTLSGKNYVQDLYDIVQSLGI